MTTQERMMEAAKLRLRFQMNSRLRLESLAAISRVLREHQEPVGDELLASLVLALPEELLGEMETASGHSLLTQANGAPGPGVPHAPPERGVPHAPPEPGVPHAPPEPGVPHAPPEPGVPHGPSARAARA